MKNKFHVKSDLVGLVGSSESLEGAEIIAKNYVLEFNYQAVIYSKNKYIKTIKPQ